MSVASWEYSMPLSTTSASVEQVRYCTFILLSLRRSEFPVPTQFCGQLCGMNLNAPKTNSSLADDANGFHNLPLSPSWSLPGGSWWSSYHCLTFIRPLGSAETPRERGGGGGRGESPHGMGSPAAGKENKRKKTNEPPLGGDAGTSTRGLELAR